jgi:hypothetical protein
MPAQRRKEGKMKGISIDGLDEALRIMLRDGEAKVIFRVIATADERIGFEGLSELQEQFLEVGREIKRCSCGDCDEDAEREAASCHGVLQKIESRWSGVSIDGLGVDEVLSSIAESLNAIFKSRILMAERSDGESGPGFAFVLGPSIESLSDLVKERQNDDSMTRELRKRANVPSSQLN